MKIKERVPVGLTSVIKELQSSEDPQLKKLGFDLEYYLLDAQNRQIVEMENQLSSDQTPEEFKKEIEKKLTKLKKRSGQLNERFANCQKERGKLQGEDQVMALAKRFSEALGSENSSFQGFNPETDNPILFLRDNLGVEINKLFNIDFDRDNNRYVVTDNNEANERFIKLLSKAGFNREELIDISNTFSQFKEIVNSEALSIETFFNKVKGTKDILFLILMLLGLGIYFQAKRALNEKMGGSEGRR